MSSAYQSYKGKITITAGTNDQIDWWESDGVSADLSTTIASGEYWPDALLTAITDAMTTESISSGRGCEYYGSIANDTGQPTITVGGSSRTWYPKITTSQSNKILTGGDPGVVDTRGDNHFGWNVASISPSAAQSQTGDTAHSNAWYPTQARQEDDEGMRQNLVIESTSIGGATEVYSFGPSTRGADPTRLRSMSYTELTQADRDQYENEFWHAYAKAGGVFQLWIDRTDSSTSVIYQLTGEALKTTAFKRARQTGAYWDLSFQLRRSSS